MKQKVYIETYGCQMNVRDSEETKGLFLRRQYALTDEMSEAQVILLNTCSVRQHAEERIFGRLGRLAKIKKASPETVIGIMGCMAQEHGKHFFRRSPHLDLVCGPGNLSEIPDLIDRINAGKRRIAATDRVNHLDYLMDGMEYRTHSVKALVNIMSGCDHRCTFCIVPMTRGIERSRPSREILSEIKKLAGTGYKDVTLLGQNVNCYGKKLRNESIDFSGLLRKIDQETPAPRIRFITSHPKDASDTLFQTMAGCESVCEHLHLPVQSGSDRVLKRMKREHTRDWYLERIKSYRSKLKGSLTTDIIVGFPGETEEDFEMTRAMMEEIRFDASFIFKYSPRPGTPAYKLEDDVSETNKNLRLQELLSLQKSITLEKNSGLLGQTLEVLFEDRNDKVASSFVGRTRQFKRVVVKCEDNLIGRFGRVRVKEVLGESLLGETESWV